MRVLIKAVGLRWDLVGSLGGVEFAWCRGVFCVT